MTRRKAIKAYYLWLHHGDRTSVRNCSMYGHPLYPYRTGRIRDDAPADGKREPDVVTGADYRFDVRLQQSKAIRLTCLGCVENVAEVRRCAKTSCPLWVYRLGKAEKTSPRVTFQDKSGGAGVELPRKAECPENDTLWLFPDVEQGGVK